MPEYSIKYEATLLDDWQDDWLVEELEMAQRSRDSIQAARLNLVTTSYASRVNEVDLAREYLTQVDLGEKLERRISTLQPVLDDRRTVARAGLEEAIEAYGTLFDGLAAIGGAAFTVTIVLVFSMVRGPLTFIRWSSLLFGVGFFVPMLVQATGRFSSGRAAAPAWARYILPLAAVSIVLLQFASFVMLYIAAVALDFRPEMTEGKAPGLTNDPPLAEYSNYVPGYVMVRALLVIGLVWVRAGIRWLWHPKRTRIPTITDSTP